MAFEKTITLNNGESGTYIVLEHETRHLARTSKASFFLFKSAAYRASAPNEPLRGGLRIAKLHLEGEKFDQYLDAAVLAAVESGDPVRAQLYAAAKAEGVISDWGADVFADATDV
jgi:hypothetical protein